MFDDAGVLQNTYQAKSYYTVHPEWNSEVVNDPSPKPLHRPPWPWEQPRYRVNMQLPTTYESPAQVTAMDGLRGKACEPAWPSGTGNSHGQASW